MYIREMITIPMLEILSIHRLKFDPISHSVKKQTPSLP